MGGRKYGVGGAACTPRGTVAVPGVRERGRRQERVNWGGAGSNRARVASRGAHKCAGRCWKRWRRSLVDERIWVHLTSRPPPECAVWAGHWQTRQ